MEGKWRYTSVEICRTVRVQVTLSWILVNHIFIQLYFGLGTIFHISFYTCYIMFVLYTVVIFLYINRHRSSVPMSIICIIWSVRSLINVEMLIGLNSINFTIKRIATRMLIELSTAECQSSCTVVCIGGASFFCQKCSVQKGLIWGDDRLKRLV